MKLICFLLEVVRNGNELRMAVWLCPLGGHGVTTMTERVKSEPFMPSFGSLKVLKYLDVESNAFI